MTDIPAYETMECDVLIVGAGPAGLSAAIRLMQLKPDANVMVIEKGSEVGAHILSGAVLDPRALNELLPDWRERGAPLHTAVTEDHFHFLTRAKQWRMPTPPPMKNHGNYIISLGNFCRWLAEQASAMGVQIFPGFTGAELILEAGVVRGVRTGAFGVQKDGTQGPNYQPPMELRAPITLLAEGCRGSLAGVVSSLQSPVSSQERGQRSEARGQEAGLGSSPAPSLTTDDSRRTTPQTYGLGIKEIWQIDPAKHVLGRVEHSIGWPLASDTYGGSFVYHLEGNQVAIGFVVGLDYANPSLDPFKEFQRFKQHPAIRPLLEGGTRIAYGARALNEGGWQSIPTLSFPGGALIGCAAGFLNVPRIKGTHTAMKSGMLAAEAVVSEERGQRPEARDQEAGLGNSSPLGGEPQSASRDAVGGNLAAVIPPPNPKADLAPPQGGSCSPASPLNSLLSYEPSLRASWVGQELYAVRNIRPAFRWGLWAGLAYAAFDTYILRGRAPWTFRHHADHAALKPAARCKPIDYPAPDGVVSFDRASSVYLANLSHEENQPTHLTLRDAAVPVAVNLAEYAGPEQRFCPAGVYEFVADADGGQRLQINAANCVHCKTCDIKDPTQNICWTTPEGGSGPNYGAM